MPRNKQKVKTLTVSARAHAHHARCIARNEFLLSMQCIHWCSRALIGRGCRRKEKAKMAEHSWPEASREATVLPPHRWRCYRSVDPDRTAPQALGKSGVVLPLRLGFELPTMCKSRFMSGFIGSFPVRKLVVFKLCLVYPNCVLCPIEFTPTPSSTKKGIATTNTAFQYPPIFVYWNMPGRVQNGMVHRNNHTSNIIFVRISNQS